MYPRGSDFPGNIRVGEVQPPASLAALKTPPRGSILGRKGKEGKDLEAKSERGKGERIAGRGRDPQG